MAKELYEDVTQEIKQNIDRLHERSQRTKSALETHEAVCAERYKNLLIALEKMDKAIEHNNSQVSNLHNLATEGRVSLRTLIKLGAFITFILSTIYILLGVYNNLP